MTVALRGMTWEHERGFNSMVAASDEFIRTKAGARVEWTYRSLQAFADEPVENLAREFDLIVIDHPHIPLAVEAGAFARLDGVGFDAQLHVLAHQAVGQSHRSYHHDGHQYGLAVDAAAQVAVRRPDLLGDAPVDWEQVMQIARDGRVLWAAKPVDSYSSLLTMAANNATPAFSTPGQFLSRDDANAVFDRMHELASLVPEFCFSASPIDVAEALCADTRWIYSPLAFGYNNYSRCGYRAFRLAYSDVPSGPAGTDGSLLGGAGIAVSAYSSHIAEARSFAFWVASSRTQTTKYFDGGGQPGNACAWDDDRLNAETMDFFRNTRATLEGAFVRPRNAGYIAFQDRVSPWVTQMLVGDMPDALLIDRMNEEAEKLAGEIDAHG